MKLKHPLSVEGLSAKDANRFLRIQLAAAHRVLSDYGLSDRNINHLSCRAPSANGERQIILITPFPLEFKDVTPSSLLGIDVETGEVVEGDRALHQISGSFHRGFYLARPETVCMMHTHSPYVCAIASLEDPTLLMLNQSALAMYNRLAYDYDFGGLVTDLNEGKRLGSLLKGKVENLILVHHGSVSAGKTISRAFNDQLALELNAKNQVLAMQTGRKLKEISKEMCELTASQIVEIHKSPVVDEHLASIIERLAKQDAEFKF